MTADAPGPEGPPDNPFLQVTLPELRRRTSAKWRTHPPDVLPLWVAEMDVLLAPPIREALHHAVEAGDTGYPAGQEYPEAVAAFAADRWGWTGLDPARTALVPDVMTGIVEVLRLVTGPGDVVVVTPPVYAPFFAFVEHAGRTVAEAPLDAGGRLDLPAVEEASAAARARCAHPAFLLCNPHNPTGAVHTREELEAVAALARRHGVRVVSDEIHAPLVLPGARFVPWLSVADDGFALVSASKAWNLAGLKAAVVVAGREATDDLARLPEVVGHGPSHLGVLAHTAAFRDGGGWLDALLAALDRNRRLLQDLVAEHLPAAGLRPPEGTYLAWLDCRTLGLPPEAPGGGPTVASDLDGPARFFLDHARVALSSGHVFGTGGAGHVRINLATSPAVLTEAVTRMGRAVAARTG
ncbi:pyridoxal phosphate-dependent aminotransferase [Blastococcus sp. MG754426]|uniref:MalY/PatB family protein n=1 Tax=unclassified Blastococcus TaxID=2619396 RepID=UPI001EF09E2A|nr:MULTISPECIES: MalY/PatB family protein [unclassified Blastococcus]MCF6508781.1 pyridoxal phosphate-dependent aminotransferase [Blastococcus sp. MG754426]MCF6513419.1 pyridoxal phosphate-dependent aminotransferase [Blastococcus sp. MG754427]